MRIYGSCILVKPNGWQCIEKHRIKQYARKLLTEGKELEWVSKFQCSGTLFHEQTDRSERLRTQIGEAGKTFHNKKNLITPNYLKL